MKSTEIIEAVCQKLALPVGRHLYGVMGTYRGIEDFAKKLQQAKTPDRRPFPKPISVNKGILNAIPDDEFKQLAENEAKHPEPTAKHVANAFGSFLRSKLSRAGILVLADFEMLFAYQIELTLLRVLATDENRVLLLLPGKRSRGRIIMFHEMDEGNYTLPTNLIAENHLWEFRE
jgi:hypothetical protein